MRIIKNIFWGILCLIFSLIPTGLFIGLWLLLHPADFWQRLILIIAGTVFLLPIQVWLSIAWLAVIVSLSGEEHKPAIAQQNFKNRIEQY